MGRVEEDAINLTPALSNKLEREPAAQTLAFARYGNVSVILFHRGFFFFVNRKRFSIVLSLLRILQRLGILFSTSQLILPSSTCLLSCRHSLVMLRNEASVHIAVEKESQQFCFLQQSFTTPLTDP
jgi:hypothetical protein